MQELIQALIRAKANFAPIVKDKTNPAFQGKKYASLDAVLEAVEPALATEGLIILQPTAVRDGKQVLLTQLWHSSGEHMESVYELATQNVTTDKTTSSAGVTVDDRGRENPLTVDTKISTVTLGDPQKAGIAITYARRYCLCAFFSITAEEDDDGNSSSKPPAARSTTKQPPRPSNPSSRPVPATEPSKPTVQHDAPAATFLNNQERFKQLRLYTGHTPDQLKELCIRHELPQSANRLADDQCTLLRDLILVDWAMLLQVFTHPNHARSSLNNVLTSFETPPTDDALWAAWETKVLAKLAEKTPAPVA